MTGFQAVSKWIIEHDERIMFTVLYVVLAVVLSVWISLFWLVAVAGGHLVLECIRQWKVLEDRGTFLHEVAWEMKLDCALILFALALSLYMEVILGVLGLQSAARTAAAVKSGARAGSRAVAWERIIRGILLSLDDVAQGTRSFVGRKAAKEDEEELPSGPPARHSWAGPWGWGDRIAVGLGVLCVVLILVSPLLTHHTPTSALATLGEELHPFPGN